MPREARSLETWVYDSKADLLQLFFVDFPPGDLPAEMTLKLRNSEGEIRPPAPFAQGGLVIYTLDEDDSVNFFRSFVILLEEEEAVESLKVRGLLPGRYQAYGIMEAIEEGEFSPVEFEVR